ncbi:MAG TPA: GAF domain-containing protein, partial [Nocardioides sp.]|nr:GAF domain-containing protein [Nocardioides sp.]
MKQPIRRTTGRSLLEERLTSGQLDDLGRVLSDAETFLGPDSLPQIDEITDFEAASQALSHGWQTIRTSALGGGSALAERVDCGSVDELMDRMIRNERVVRTAQVSQRDSAVRTVREALADLRDVTDTSLVIRAGAEAICRLGFDRAIVSRVEENTWLTEAIYVDGDSEWAAEILQAGRTMPQAIDGTLPEHEVRRRKRPVVVTRVQEREAVHRAVADASLSRSYVAAPIAPSNRVLGFLHADRFFHRGDVTEFDAEVLGLFAQGYAFAMERAMVMEELEQMRARIRDLGAGLVAFASDGTDALPGLARGPQAL